MILELPQLEEFHSSDMTATCLRSVQHRLLGEYEPSIGTAMLKGLLFGASMERVHNEHRWEVDLCPEAVALGLKDTKAKMVEEGRMLSDGAIKNLDESVALTIQACGYYVERFGDKFKRCSLIGTEVPIRYTMEHPMLDEPVNFASHLDLLFRDPNNVWGYGTDRLHCWDWKWHTTTPTIGVLLKNLQMGLYYVAIKHGAILRDEQHDIWQRQEEYPLMSWVSVNDLFPYKRKTTTSDEVYLKGDSRPLDRVVKTIPLSNEDIIIDDLAQRVLSMRQGIYLKMVSPSCAYCQSRDWCTTG